MRVLVTGATGFLGRHVISQIRAGEHNILGFTLKNDAPENSIEGIQWLYGDLNDLAALKPAIRSFDPQVVIHLAWQGIPDYSEVVSKINLNNSIQLFDFILKETNCKKIIAAGSCLEYGKVKGICKESDPVAPNSFFAWAKHSLWQYLLLKCNARGVKLVWFRIFYAYGPGQRAGSLVPLLFAAFKENKVPDIAYPLNKNDFVFIEDIAQVFRLAVEEDIPTGIYNLGSGVSRSVYDICKIVEELLRPGPEISKGILKNGKKEKKSDFASDMRKTIKSFSWRPGTTLEKGVAKHIESLK